MNAPLALTLRRLDTASADFDRELDRLIAFEAAQDPAIDAAVAAIIADVRRRGDAALLDYTERFDRLHAASVGEVQACAALLAQLRHDLPALPLLLSVGTPTGLARARSLFAPEDWPCLTVQAAPWDLPGAVRRFLDATSPRAVVIIETELWPNLIAAARSRALPLALASARMSSRPASW